MKLKSLIFFITFFLLPILSHSDEKRIIVSIKPLHSIILNVVDEEKVDLLLDGSLSPHDYKLKPSDMKKLENADLIFYVDAYSLETFLARPLKAIDKKIKKISIISNNNLELLQTREGGIWEKEQSGHDHSHGEYDPHVWLDSENVIKITKQVVKELSKINPSKKNKYKKNAQSFIKKVNINKIKMNEELMPIASRSFIVFHDAYQYYEKEFGLNGAGSISINPEISPSPKRINEIRSKIKRDNVQCVFKEPQFPSKIVQTIIKNTNTKEGLLDPLGSNLKPGKDLYLNLINNLSKNLKKCLF